jgi:nucleoside-diphosphate-sugar epimerase
MVLKQQLIGMKKINNILITGGAGFIGSHLTKRLVNKGYKVTVIDNLERGKLEFLPSNISFHKLDLRDYESVKDLFKNQDCVIHLASKVGGIGTYLSQPYEVMKSNISMDSNVLRGIIENKINKYFYASSAHIYPKELQTVADSPMIKENQAYPSNPELTYGWAKLIGEIAIESAIKEYPFIKAAIARFIGIYGPNQDFNLSTGSVIPVFSHRAIKYPEIPFNIWGTGKETRSYCYIEDALDAIETMIDTLDEKQLVGPYNVGKNERVTISDIAETVVSISNKDINIEYDTTKNTVIWGQWCDCSMIKNDLGWEAKTSLREGLENVYNDIKFRLQ